MMRTDNRVSRDGFLQVFNHLPVADLLHRAESATDVDVVRSLARPVRTLEDFAVLISDAANRTLENLCLQSMQLTQQRFGQVIRLFAPLYLSNECINNCRYCGFSRDNPILRLTLNVDEVVQEGRMLHDQGFRNILLVSGEHPKFVSNGYMEECIRKLRAFIPSISLEIGPMETQDYMPLVSAGSEGLVVYQETYDRTVYQEMHTSGPKKRL
ncbi:MAG: hypothetical protein LR011_12685 [Verrucomicrobia bacterium]|nr:hypothetical protein [Verrucomicrobiota bacterium]